MRITILLLAAAVAVLSGCVITPGFYPTTIAGATCKQQCAAGMASCHASSYTCDRSYGKCLEACIDIDRVTLGGK